MKTINLASLIAINLFIILSANLPDENFLPNNNQNNTDQEFIKLENDIDICIISDPCLSESIIEIEIKCGSIDDNEEQCGISEITRKIFADYIQKYSSKLFVYSNVQLTKTIYTIISPNKDLPNVIEKFCEILQNPYKAFFQIDREIESAVYGFEAKAKDDFWLSKVAWSNSMNNKRIKHAFDNIKEYKDKILPVNVINWIDRHYSNQNCKFTIASKASIQKTKDIITDKISKLNRFSTWRRENIDPPYIFGDVFSFIEKNNDKNLLHINIVLSPNGTIENQAEYNLLESVVYKIKKETHPKLISERYINKIKLIKSLEESNLPVVYTIIFELTDNGVKNWISVINKLMKLIDRFYYDENIVGITEYLYTEKKKEKKPSLSEIIRAFKTNTSEFSLSDFIIKETKTIDYEKLKEASKNILNANISITLISSKETWFDSTDGIAKPISETYNIYKRSGRPLVQLNMPFITFNLQCPIETSKSINSTKTNTYNYDDQISSDTYTKTNNFFSGSGIQAITNTLIKNPKYWIAIRLQSEKHLSKNPLDKAIIKIYESILYSNIERLQKNKYEYGISLYNDFNSTILLSSISSSDLIDWIDLIIEELCFKFYTKNSFDKAKQNTIEKIKLKTNNFLNEAILHIQSIIEPFGVEYEKLLDQIESLTWEQFIEALSSLRVYHEIFVLKPSTDENINLIQKIVEIAKNQIFIDKTKSFLNSSPKEKQIKTLYRDDASSYNTVISFDLDSSNIEENIANAIILTCFLNNVSGNELNNKYIYKDIAGRSILIGFESSDKVSCNELEKMIIDKTSSLINNIVKTIQSNPQTFDLAVEDANKYWSIKNTKAEKAFKMLSEINFKKSNPINFYEKVSQYISKPNLNLFIDFVNKLVFDENFIQIVYIKPSEKC